MYYNSAAKKRFDNYMKQKLFEIFNSK